MLTRLSSELTLYLKYDRVSRRLSRIRCGAIELRCSETDALRHTLRVRFSNFKLEAPDGGLSLEFQFGAAAELQCLVPCTVVAKSELDCGDSTACRWARRLESPNKQLDIASFARSFLAVARNLKSIDSADFFKFLRFTRFQQQANSRHVHKQSLVAFARSAHFRGVAF